MDLHGFARYMVVIGLTLMGANISFDIDTLIIWVVFSIVMCAIILAVIREFIRGGE